MGDVDLELGSAVRAAVRAGLRNLGGLVAGTKDAGPTPIFLVEAEVEKAENVGCVPSLATVQSVVHACATNIVQAAQAVPRIPKPKSPKEAEAQQIAAAATAEAAAAGAAAATSAASPDDSEPTDAPPALATATNGATTTAMASTTTTAAKPSGASGSDGPGTFYELIFQEPELTKLMERVMRAVHGADAALRSALDYWAKYKNLWAVDRHNFVRNYNNQHEGTPPRSLADMESEFEAFKATMFAAASEPVASAVAFLKVDCTKLRAELVKHAAEWQKVLTGLLNQMAKKELDEVVALFAKRTAELSEPPADLDHLSASLNLLAELNLSVVAFVLVISFGFLIEVLHSAVHISWILKMGALRCVSCSPICLAIYLRPL